MASGAIQFPFADPPGPGETVPIGPGLLWARVELPFHLDHVNVYLIEEEGGWAAFDAGASHPISMAAWRALLSGPLRGGRLTRIIVSHFHPDHVGLAGWLAEVQGAQIWTTRTCESTTTRLLAAGPAPVPVRFNERAGLAPDRAAEIPAIAYDYCRTVGPLPAGIIPIEQGQELAIGRHRFRALFGDGHAVDQLMLWDGAERLLLVADQVLARISPHVGVGSENAEDDVLGAFLDSTATLATTLPADTLLCPGHGLPFRGLHSRCAALIAHHRARCGELLESCRSGERTLLELVPVLFPRELDDFSLALAISETAAHVNFLSRRGLLHAETDAEGLLRLTASAPEAELAAPFAALQGA